jgi:hypothetical protein
MEVDVKTRRRFVKPVYRVDGVEYVGGAVEYVKSGSYSRRILMLSDYVVCGRDADRWVCIDRENGRVFSSDSIPGVVYAYYGGVRRVVEEKDRVVVEAEGGVVELSDVY